MKSNLLINRRYNTVLLKPVWRYSLLLTLCLILGSYSGHAQGIGYHDTINMVVQPHTNYTIKFNRRAGSMALSYSSNQNPEGAYIVTDLSDSRSEALSASRESNDGGFTRNTNLVFLGPVWEGISLYTAGLSGKIVIHTIYVPPLQIDIHHVLSRGSGIPCDRPATLKQSIWRQGLPAPTVFPTPTQVKHVIVHHTATSNTDTDYTATVRSIYMYHTQVNGWDDIGYNFLIAPDGVIYDGRDGQGSYDDDNVKGAHLCGKNSNTMGVSMIGTFTDTIPTDTALASLRHLAVWKLNKEKLYADDSTLHPVGDPNATYLKVLAGHRDACATECPGNHLYPLLKALRKAVELAGANCAPYAASIGYRSMNGSSMRIYPQPADNYIIVDNADRVSGNAHYSIYDLSGREIQSGSLSADRQAMIHLEQLKQGSYILSIKDMGGEYRSLLIKR